MSIGLENGEIFLYSCGKTSDEVLDVKLFSCGDQRLCHVSAVKKLQWNSVLEHLLLASCSSDNSVRIFQLKL